MDTTLEQFAIEYMTERGVWPEDAQTILQAIKDNKDNESLNGRWQHSTFEYPEVLYKAVLIMKINRFVLQWCEQNAPNAVFKYLFGG